MCISARLSKCVTRPGLSIPDSDLGLTQVEFQPPVSHKTKTFRLCIWHGKEEYSPLKGNPRGRVCVCQKYHAKRISFDRKIDFQNFR